MRTVKVKICGIRSLETAQTVIESGADFIGFNFVRTSHRFIDPYICQTFMPEIKGKIKIVGVFQNATIEEVNYIAELLNLDFVQLHGDEDKAYVKKIKLPVIKSIVNLQKEQQIKVPYLLVDRIEQGKGALVNIFLAKKIAEKYKVFFAGGLTPENVVQVVKTVKPFAVDVAGGVETNGREDHEKIKKFIANVKGVEL
jgi:phosphoribosylanthranilate isomerase